MQQQRGVDGRVTYYAYDPYSGRLDSKTVGDRVLRMDFDPMGRLCERTASLKGLSQRETYAYDGNGKLIFKMDEIGEYLGREMTAEIFEVNTSTHYGRMVRIDDNTVILFGNMDEVFEYI